jgi:hypothetical protein
MGYMAVMAKEAEEITPSWMTGKNEAGKKIERLKGKTWMRYKQVATCDSRGLLPSVRWHRQTKLIRIMTLD